MLSLVVDDVQTLLRFVPLVSPPQRPWHQIGAFLGQRMPLAGDLRIRQSRHGVEPPFQVARLGAAVDHHGHERPLRGMGGGAGRLALAVAGVAAQQQRAAGCFGGEQGGDGVGVELVDRAGPGAVAGDRDGSIGGVGGQRRGLLVVVTWGRHSRFLRFARGIPMRGRSGRLHPANALRPWCRCARSRPPPA